MTIYTWFGYKGSLAVQHLTTKYLRLGLGDNERQFTAVHSYLALSAYLGNCSYKRSSQRTCVPYVNNLAYSGVCLFFSDKQALRLTSESTYHSYIKGGVAYMKTC